LPKKGHADHYAVLVAGSHTYGNYRHHADVAHAYQIALKQGMSPDNIIVMMYDDVVNDNQNPFPGQLFNAPTAAGTPGVDVYRGVRKDYTGKSVTAKNFLSVITGDAAAMQGIGSGRVLNSTAEDRVFINFVDHGGVGLIAFPNQPYLYARDLIAALQTMHTKNLYKELVFYVEACESGSMFKTLPDDLNIYVTTAANGKESSWGTYCAPNDSVNGQNINSCLGDLYSVNWMENSETSDLKTETLEQQYKAVKKLTNKSHVMQFPRNSAIVQEPVGDFIGTEDPKFVVDIEEKRQQQQKHLQRHDQLSLAAADGAGMFDSRDNELFRLFHAYARSGDAEYGDKLIAEVKDREQHDARFEAIASKVVGAHNLEMTMGARADPMYTQCHKDVNAAYDKYCGGFSDYALKHVRLVVNLCESVGEGNSYEHIVSAVQSVCSSNV
jgi:legumain